MHIINKLTIAFVTAVTFTFTVFSAPVINKLAPVFSGIDTYGAKVSLADFMGKPIILEWTNHECPYVRKHYNSGNMQRLQRDLTEAGVIWISIISSAAGMQGYVSAKQANELAAERGAYANVVLLDESGDIGRLYNAKTTPEMFLIDEQGVLRYMGAIDDKPSAQSKSLKGAHNYVRSAWASFSAGTEITSTVTKPYGCSVKYAH